MKRRDEITYTQRLSLLNWYTIASRFDIILLSFIVKCLFGRFECLQVTSNIAVNTRHNDSLMFKHIFARTEFFRTHPINTFPRLWSDLPGKYGDKRLYDSLQAFLLAIKHTTVFYPRLCNRFPVPWYLLYFIVFIYFIVLF